MPWAAAAAVGGAVIGAVATSNAADKSADAIEDSADASAATQRYMYDTNRADQAPYRQIGTSALNRLAAIYGLPQYQSTAAATEYSPEFDGALVENRAGVPSVNARLYANDPVYRQAWDEALSRHQQAFGIGYDDHSNFQALEYDLRSAMEANPAYRNRTESPIQGRTGDTINGATGQVENDWSSFFDSPDYQFTFSEGQRAVNSGLAARGLSNSGAAMKELTRYGQGAASTQLNTYLNRLSSLAGIGQTATQATGSAGVSAANGISQSQMAAGDARASAYTARGNAINNAINQGAGIYALSQLQTQPSGYYQTNGGTGYTNGRGFAQIGGV